MIHPNSKTILALELVACRLCGATPNLPELWTSDGGDYSRKCKVACGCGAMIQLSLAARYEWKNGETIWQIIRGEWDATLTASIEKWNQLHQ